MRSKLLGSMLDSVLTLAISVGSAAATGADSKLDYRAWAASAKTRISETPYWLFEFPKDDAFKTRSIELLKVIPSIKGTDTSPFCMVMFHEIGTSKSANMVCVNEFTSNGYDGIWKSYSVDLGTGRGGVNDPLVGEENGYGVDYGKCTKRSLAFLINLTLRSGLFPYDNLSEYRGNAAIYIYRDKFEGVSAWLNEYGTLRKEAKSSRKRKRRR